MTAGVRTVACPGVPCGIARIKLAGLQLLPDRSMHAAAVPAGTPGSTERGRRLLASRRAYCRSTSALKLRRPSSRLLPFKRLTMSASAILPNTPPGNA
jgi:hypothetical protein